MKKTVFIFAAILTTLVALSFTSCGGWKSYDGKSEDEVMKIAYDAGHEWAQVTGLENLDKMLEDFKQQSFGDNLTEEDNKVFLKCRDEAMRGVADAVLDVWKITETSVGGYGLDMTPEEIAKVCAKNGGKAAIPSNYESEFIDFPSLGKSRIMVDLCGMTPMVINGKWNNIKPSTIECELDKNTGAGALNNVLIDRIVNHVKSLGKVVKEFENDGILYTVVSTKDGKCFLFGNTKNKNQDSDNIEITLNLYNASALKKQFDEAGMDIDL